MPLGHPGLHRLKDKEKDKMLLFFNLIRTNVKFPLGQEPTSVTVPLVYDVYTNQTTTTPPGNQKDITPVVSIASQVLTGLAKSGQLNLNQCTIWPSVQVRSVFNIWKKRKTLLQVYSNIYLIFPVSPCMSVILNSKEFVFSHIK